ncbi:MAG: hypothetical protein QWI36_00425 [Wolbachia endosymbiont of Tyrophagus putrescentiae]|nr:hypothetical protein [Wolbachia endosymbiont of Tyrophagus putrescentiae]
MSPSQDTTTCTPASLKEKVLLAVEKSIRSACKRTTSASSMANLGMSGITQVINFINHSAVATNILRGNAFTSVALNVVSLTLNTYSLINHLRWRKLCKLELEEKKKEKFAQENRHKLQNIFLDLLCDTLFLSAAVVTIILPVNPITLFIIIPLLVLGCAVMVGSIAKSIVYQVKQFNALSEIDQKKIKDEHQDKVRSSLIYRVISIILPEFVLLAKLYDQQQRQKTEEEMKTLKKLRNQLQNTGNHQNKITYKRNMKLGTV